MDVLCDTVEFHDGRVADDLQYVLVNHDEIVDIPNETNLQEKQITRKILAS